MNDIDELVAFALEQDLLDDPYGQSQLNAFAHGAVDPYLVAELQDRVKGRLRHMRFNGPSHFKVPKLTRGPLVLGTTVSPPTRPIRVPLSVLQGNVLTFAGSGGGKNVATHFHAVQIAAELVRGSLHPAGAPKVSGFPGAGAGTGLPGMWMVSPAKAEFGLLKNAIARIGADLLVLKGRDLRLNPLQPPRGVDPRAFAAQVADRLAAVLSAPRGAARVIEKTVVLAYRQKGCLDTASPRIWPTLFELRDLIKADRDAHPQSRSSLVNELDALLEGAGEVFNYSLGWDPADLAEGFFLALSLTDLSEVAKDLVLNDLVLRLFASRVASGVSNPGKILTYLLVDEANRLAGVQGSGRSALSDLMPLVRGMGVVIHLLAQTADLHPAVMANTATKFLGRTTHYPDLVSIGRSMGLTGEQLRHVANTLKPGRWITQLGDSAIGRQPFELQIPNVDFTKVKAAPPYGPAKTSSHSQPNQTAPHTPLIGHPRERLLALPAH